LRLVRVAALDDTRLTSTRRVRVIRPPAFAPAVAPPDHSHSRCQQTPSGRPVWGASAPAPTQLNRVVAGIQPATHPPRPLTPHSGSMTRQHPSAVRNTFPDADQSTQHPRGMALLGNIRRSRCRTHPKLAWSAHPARHEW
jgi:hypothetical protein